MYPGKLLLYNLLCKKICRLLLVKISGPQLTKLYESHNDCDRRTHVKINIIESILMIFLNS